MSPCVGSSLTSPKISRKRNPDRSVLRVPSDAASQFVAQSNDMFVHARARRHRPLPQATRARVSPVARRRGVGLSCARAARRRSAIRKMG